MHLFQETTMSELNNSAGWHMWESTYIHVSKYTLLEMLIWQINSLKTSQTK